jgi:hypothetical protein
VVSSSSPFTHDDVRAAAETHQELGPDYQAAVIDSFLDKVGREIDARVDARMAAPRQAHYPQPAQPAQPPAHHPHGNSAFALAVISMVLGIPLSAIAVSAGSHPVGLSGLLVIWLAITAINVAYSLRTRPPSGRR